MESSRSAPRVTQSRVEDLIHHSRYALAWTQNVTQGMKATAQHPAAVAQSGRSYPLAERRHSNQASRSCRPPLDPRTWPQSERHSALWPVPRAGLLRLAPAPPLVSLRQVVALRCCECGAFRRSHLNRHLIALLGVASYTEHAARRQFLPIAQREVDAIRREGDWNLLGRLPADGTVSGGARTLGQDRHWTGRELLSERCACSKSDKWVIASRPLLSSPSS